MMCEGPHHICACKEHLLMRVIDILSDIRRGMAEFKKTASQNDKKRIHILCNGAIERIERVVIMARTR